MPKPLQTQLRVPADGRFLVMVQQYVRELASTARLPHKDVLALELAAEEAFLNIRDHAYPDGTEGDVFVDGEIHGSELRLAFRDEGLPFDPTLSSLPAPHASQDSGEVVGLGTRLIHHAVDEVHWVNHGRQGKALCLIKRLPEAAEPPPSVLPEKIQKAPARHYDIRPMRPDEALQVTQIFWLAYGYSYKNENFYRPEGLVHLVGSGRLISYVAVTERGEVAAHAGLLRPESLAVAEMALLVVSPAHRGQGLMDALTKALAAKANDLQLFGLTYNPVTSHAVSQRQVMLFGASPCGLDLAACPPRRFKAMRLDAAPAQRESYLSCFQYLTTPPPALVHVPKRHRDMVEHVYAGLQRPVTFAPGKQNATTGDYTVAFDRALQKGAIRVARADAGQWSELHRAAIDLSDIAGAEVVNLDLPVAQPGTPLLCERAEDAGFFFSGIWPHGAEDGDILRLTRLRVPIDLGLLRLHETFGQVIAHYVGAEMERAAALQGQPRSKT